jgi:ABC-type dipeptide/oligopeptide/nickel transport system permease subunit
MDQRVIFASLMLVSAIAGASIVTVTDADMDSMNRTITGINGTNQITLAFDPDNDSVHLYGYDELGRDVFHSEYYIMEK